MQPATAWFLARSRKTKIGDRRVCVWRQAKASAAARDVRRSIGLIGRASVHARNSWRGRTEQASCRGVPGWTRSRRDRYSDQRNVETWRPSPRHAWVADAAHGLARVHTKAHAVAHVCAGSPGSVALLDCRVYGCGLLEAESRKEHTK